MIDLKDDLVRELTDSEGWLNGTKFCAEFDKVPEDFFNREYTQAFIKHLNDSNPELLAEGVSKVVNGELLINPNLVVLFRKWVDVNFEIWCDDQIFKKLYAQTYSNSNQDFYDLHWKIWKTEGKLKLPLESLQDRVVLLVNLADNNPSSIAVEEALTDSEKELLPILKGFNQSMEEAGGCKFAKIQELLLFIEAINFYDSTLFNWDTLEPKVYQFLMVIKMFFYRFAKFPEIKELPKEQFFKMLLGKYIEWLSLNPDRHTPDTAH